jgi:hypothetical protein
MLALRGACVLLLLGLGCRSVQIDVGPAASPTATVAAAPTQKPTTTPPAPTATTPPGPTATSRPEVKPTEPVATSVKPTEPVATSVKPTEPVAASSPTAGDTPLQVNIDGEVLTQDSLPTPETYYAQLLKTYGQDVSTCQRPATPQPAACPKPASLGDIELKQQVNVELILDASGSMAESEGGETRLATAQRVLSDFITTLPPRANVALRVYGHKGSNAEADKPVSCASSELLYPFQALNADLFQSVIRGFQPTGWTPLAASLDGAQHDFEQFDPATSSNFV